MRWYGKKFPHPTYGRETIQNYGNQMMSIFNEIVKL